MFRGKFEEFLMSKTKRSLLLPLFSLLLLVQISAASANEPAFAAGSASTGIQQDDYVPFRGVWDTVSSQGNKYTMVLHQDGRKVWGTYTPHDGRIEGQVTGRVFRFKWRQGNQRGSGRFTLSSSARAFEGTWSNSDDPDDPSGGTWNGDLRKHHEKLGELSPDANTQSVGWFRNVKVEDIKSNSITLSFTTMAPTSIEVGVESSCGAFLHRRCSYIDVNYHKGERIKVSEMKKDHRLTIRLKPLEHSKGLTARIFATTQDGRRYEHWESFTARPIRKLVKLPPPRN